MRMTSKGQVTVPKEFRDDLELKPGTEVGFDRNDRGEIVLVNLDKRKGESAGQRLVRQLLEFGDKARREGWLNDMSTDEIMDMTRGPDRDGNARRLKHHS
jgi:AbrB family looped-hinge helix DNA binding protein